jgi:hypothetical protein
MRSRKKYGWSALLALVGLGATLGGVYAAQQITGRSVELPAQRPLEEDVHAAGGTVLIAAPVRGDVAAAGQTVTVSGPVTGYVLAAGSNVSVRGKVGNDLWAAGANVDVEAPVADTAMLAGQTVLLQPGASVGGDACIAGSSVEVRGPVRGDLRLAAATGRIAAPVGGSVRAHVQQLRLDPGAVVRGDLIVTSPKRPEISPQAKVLGRVIYQPADGRAETHRPSPWSWVGWWIFRFLALMIVGAVALAVSPLWAERVSGTITHGPGPAALAGLLGLILIPVVALALLITVVGAPLAAVLSALYVALLVMAGVFVSYLIGGWVVDRPGHRAASPIVRLAWGALILSALMALPWLGGLVRLVTVVVGFGALLVERRDFLLRLREAGLA